MTFPYTSVLDDFNRGDGDAGADWSELMRSDNDFNISGNQLVDDGWNAEIYNPSTYGPDCEAYLTMATLMAQGSTVEVWLRVADVTVDAYQYDGYRCAAYRYDNGGQDTMFMGLYRIDNAVNTLLGSGVEITDHGNGDKVGCRIIGPTLELWYDDGAGWELRDEQSDATYGAAGYLAVYLADSVEVVDDFGGGTARIPRYPATVFQDPAIF